MGPKVVLGSLLLEKDQADTPRKPYLLIAPAKEAKEVKSPLRRGGLELSLKEPLCL